MVEIIITYLVILSISLTFNIVLLAIIFIDNINDEIDRINN